MNEYICHGSDDEQGMFSNIGSKIKALATFVTCVGIIGSVMIGIE